mgnify:CR=1 FL=1
MKNIAVIGAGTMGNGIAHVFAQNGFTVQLIDLNEAQLEKAVATAAKFQLFEFNDQFTRAQFRNLVEPFLRDVQGRRGITDFKVVCDETNNTGDVIDRNEFRADIFVKPARSINFITLTFVATRSSISFEEVGA